MSYGTGHPAQYCDKSKHDQSEKARPGWSVGRLNGEARDLVAGHDGLPCGSTNRRPLGAYTDPCEGGFSRLGGPTWSCAEWHV